MITIDLFQAIGHSTRSASDPTRNIDKQRVITIHGDVLLVKLLFQPFSGNTVSQKQIS